MAENSVSIFNLAMDQIGGDLIENFYPYEKTPNAKRAKRWYDISRRTVLEAFDWNFARRIAELNPSSYDPTDDWQFRYDWPADAIAARYIWNPLGKEAKAIPYDQLMGDNLTTRTILTNMPEAKLVYTFDQAATELFPASFVNLLVHLIAANAAYTVTRKQAIQADRVSAYFNMTRFVPGTDANQQVPGDQRDPDFISGR